MQTFPTASLGFICFCLLLVVLVDCLALAALLYAQQVCGIPIGKSTLG